MPARQRCEGARELVPGEPEALALDLQAHEERPAGVTLAHVLVGGEDVAVVHRDERGDRRDETLLIRAGDQESEVVTHGRRTLRSLRVHGRIAFCYTGSRTGKRPIRYSGRRIWVIAGS